MAIIGATSDAIRKTMLTTVGDMIYASAVGNPARLAAVAAGQALVSQGVGVAPAYAFGSGFGSRVRVWLSAAFNPATGVWVKVPFDTETYDNLNEFDPVTNYRFTAIAAGRYLVIGSVFYSDLPANTAFEVSIYVNNAGVTRSRARSNIVDDNRMAVAADIIQLAANDYVELFTLHDGAATEPVTALSTVTYMSIHRLS